MKTNGLSPRAAALLVALGSAFSAEARPANPAMVAARSKIFGPENVDQKSGEVDQRRVVFSWLTNATYAVAAHGHVMLLDSFVTRLEVMPGRTPFVIQDLVDLRPEAILLGHGHFDHADNAAYIAQQTGSTIYASAETCPNMALDATRNVNSGYTKVPGVTCVPLTSPGSLPGAEIVAIDQFEPDLSIQVFKHLHSTNTGADDPDAVPLAPSTPDNVCLPTKTHGNTFPCNLPDPRDPMLFPAGTPLSSVMNISTSHAGNGGAVAMFYVVTVHGPNEFKFVWHNSTGDIVDSCALPNNIAGTNPPQPSMPGQDSKGCFPGVTVNGKTVGANLASIMDSIAPVDVQLGSVVSLGYNQNGERDVVSYMAHLQPKVFIPGHMTAVAKEGSSLEWKVGFYDALRAASSSEHSQLGASYSAIPEQNWPEVPWLVDPNDYLRPLVYTPSDARWKKASRTDDDDDSDGD